jgi:GAF domain-containing protein
MIPAPLPPDEERRLAALQSYGVLDTPPEDRFDRVTGMVSAVLGAPIVLVSLIDEDRQWFKSRCGLATEQTARDVSLCGHAIMSDEPLVVPDATADARFADNPLVLGPPHLRTYLGAPLIAPCGARIGTLCAIWSEVTPVTDDQVDKMRSFASIVMERLEESRGDTPEAMDARRRLHR